MAAATPCTPAGTIPCRRLSVHHRNPHDFNLIVNARPVNEGREFNGDLRFNNGRIDQIGGGLATRDGETVVDAAGRRLLPGMIEDQAHFREPGMQYKADMAIESAAAVAGNLTSMMDMPNTNPPTLDAVFQADRRHTPYTVQRSDVVSKCGWSTFKGMTFHSRIAATWLSGVLEWDGSGLVGNPVGQGLQLA